MYLKTILGISCLSASSILSAYVGPKFDYDELISEKVIGSNFESAVSLTVQSEKFQMQTLLNGNNVVQGTNRIVTYSSQTISLIDIKEDNTLELKEEFTKAELGLSNKDIIKIELSNDDNTLYVLTLKRDYQNNEFPTDLHSYSINERGIELVEELNELYNTSSSWGVNMYRSDNGEQLLVTNNANNTLRVVTIDPATGSATLTHSGDLTFDTRFGMIDSTNDIMTLVYESYSASARNCIESFALDDSGSITSIDNISCDSGNIPHRINGAEYNAKSGHFLIKGSDDFAVVDLDSSGNLNSLINMTTLDGLNTNSSLNLMLKDHSIGFIEGHHPGTFEIFSYQDNGVIANEFSIDFTTLTNLSSHGTLLNLKNDDYFFSRSNSEFAVISQAGDYSLTSQTSGTLRDNSVIDAINSLIIPIEDDLIISVGANSLNLINTEESKRFEIHQSINLQQRLNINSKLDYVQINESTYILFDRSRYFIISYDKDTQNLVLVNDGAYVDTNNQSLFFQTSSNGELLKTWVEDKFLIAKTGFDRLAVFELIETELVFKEYLVDLAAGFEGITGTTNFITLDKDIFLVQGNTGLISKLSINEGQITQESEPTHFHGLNQSGSVVDVGDMQLILQHNQAFSFSKNNNELELLTISPISQSPASWLVLDDRHIIFAYSSFFEVYSMDQETGALIYTERLSFEDAGMPLQSSSVRKLHYDGENIWYISSFNPKTVGKMQLNRAPVWVDDNQSSIALNEGANQIYSITDFIVDLDVDDTISVEEKELPSSLKLSADLLTLEYDGTIESITEAVVSASDGILDSTFYFDLLFNFAPSLNDPTIVFSVNENESIITDLTEFYVDEEDDRYTLSLNDFPSLNILENGTLTGEFNQSGEQLVEVIATDVRGATKSEVIQFNVNGVPVVSGSSSITASTGDQITVDLNSIFSDPEGDSLSFVVQGLPSGLNLSGSSITGKITVNGSYSAVVTAKDSLGATKEQTIIFKANSNSGGGGSLTYILGLLFLLVGGRRLR